MKRVVCIGGPLHGMKVRSADLIARTTAWGAAGIHGDVGDQYVPFNRQNGGRAVPTSIYLHRSLLDNSDPSCTITVSNPTEGGPTA